VYLASALSRGHNRRTHLPRQFAASPIRIILDLGPPARA
jgi:hypothetical protein